MTLARATPLTALCSVVRTIEPIAAGTDLGLLRDGEIAGAEETVGDGLLMRAVRVDPQAWTLVRFDCFATPQDALPPGAFSYEVLHVSAPNPDV